MTFDNEPLLELRRAPVRAALEDALARLELPVGVPVLVGGERRFAADFESTDPGAPDRAVAVATCASDVDVDAAVERARRWRAPAGERAAALRRAADRLRERRHELAALVVRECAKPWLEADADVCEAVDHLRFAALATERLAEREPLVQMPGERNTLRHDPRGVAAVISPWNFPLAIPAGMTAAALATGNAVVLKPAEQSPACALALVEALRAGGVPDAAISLLPGFGDAGAALIRHPGVHTIAFTGSSEVGLEIVRAAADTPSRQLHVKRVVAEMGGKNCVLVDADADLDEAVPALIRSAFDYAGQKCSAAARALVHEAVADTLLERLTGALDALVVGAADEFGTDVPPLIEEDALDRVRRYRTIAERDGQLVEAPVAVPATGWYGRPMLATRLPPGSPVVNEEIFGPLLTVERVASMDEACDLVDASPFALTGGLFSRDPHTIERVVARSPVGNLYVNRHITGAKVGRQPFGGSRRSGIGPKLGSADYLLEFVEARVVTENTVRHGLVVE